MYLVAKSHQTDGPKWSLKTMSDRLFIPQAFISDVLQALETKELLVKTATEPPFYVPTKSIDTVTVKHVYDAVRHYGDDYHVARECDDLVNETLTEIDRAITDCLGEKTLRDLVNQD